MFAKEYKFKIGTNYVLNFVRLLGRYGLKFEIGNVRYDVDNDRFGVDGLEVQRKSYYRIFKVYANRWQMAKLYEAASVLKDYNMK